MAYKIEINYQQFIFTKLEDALNCFRAFAASVQVDNVYPKKADGTDNYQLEPMKVGRIPSVSISFCDYDVIPKDEYESQIKPHPMNAKLKFAVESLDNTQF